MAELECLSEHDWRRLARTIQGGKCILLLGPAVAVDPRGDDRVPLSALLARKLAEHLEPSCPVVNRDDLAHVTQLYQAQPRMDRLDLQIAVTDFYAPHEEQTTRLHKELATLPFTLCVNTTPDRFMANGFQEAGKQPLTEYYHYKKDRSVALAASNQGHPIVFNLYGSWVDPDSMVLTESDLLEFLVNVVSKRPPLPQYLTSRFRDPDTSFLFVGFGFRNWYVRILLHALQAQGHRTHSLALEEPGFFSHPDKADAVAFFEQEHLIGFKLISWDDFASELKRHHDALLGDHATPATDPPRDAPLAFLCHCHEDREAVIDLANCLRGLGLRVWLDRQNLRGGDDWDRLIPSVLDKVDYVVVVQSPAAVARVESYVHKEVRTALARQQHFASGYRFIVPVILGHCEGFPDLAHLQSIDVSTRGGVEALGLAIQEDWGRRNVTAPARGAAR